VIGLMVAMAIMWFYSITREKAAETQHRLRAKAS
jgi:Na+/melibiose symporter-like transporter